jgi:3-methyladenine DNA glycosylase AlkC
MSDEKGITQYFGRNLAETLAGKIQEINHEFPSRQYITAVEKRYKKLGYTERIQLHAEELKNYLPEDYFDSTEILLSILGPENPEETGMFKHFYWIMPIGKFVENYGIKYFDRSMHLIEEITKRNTGEYAIRPFIRKYPDEVINQMMEWAESDNFHLRRLASEGLRPKLPWSTKLDTFNDTPERVFRILEILKEDEIMFVKKSVANHITDWLKVNKSPTVELVKEWSKSKNKNTQWIVERATRKIEID